MGAAEGAEVGLAVVGAAEGAGVGSAVVGAGEGAGVGSAVVGDADGNGVGLYVGALVGSSVIVSGTSGMQTSFTEQGYTLNLSLQQSNSSSHSPTFPSILASLVQT